MKCDKPVVVDWTNVDRTQVGLIPECLEAFIGPLTGSNRKRCFAVAKALANATSATGDMHRVALDDCFTVVHGTFAESECDVRTGGLLLGCTLARILAVEVNGVPATAAEPGVRRSERTRARRGRQL